ncbi:glycoside hydrolase family 32 protein [Streptococcus pluranimalium]|uniref:glycoside hydrolase family 32 protein n=1 Tax=Streptococcus pluranimalium TaxID=82348 RepID=UPI0024154F0C|nr:glycoside hydrolase family 32 protein [Streptococcus pluranimalium]WFM80360.1 glycoside hydrolase family 32 protein [Streptococcus pluranimalium]
MTEIYTVERANQFIQKNKDEVNRKFKPKHHFSAEIGWINDPNGFVYFQGEYHLFYQFYPYDSVWGPMHWGHAKTKDFVNWEHLPVALAPDMPYDKDGCFSGSAIVKDDVLWLMYTGNVEQEDGTIRQIQNMAYSKDGIHFEKIAENPVATGDILPDELVKSDFRDPKIFEKEGRYYAVVAAKHQEDIGTIVLLGSDNLIDWEFESIFLKGTPEQGIMWECPDYFNIDGNDILMMSPMRVKQKHYDFKNINSSVIMTGKVDWNTKTFTLHNMKELDHGHDFYAPQSLEDDEGRRIVIAWLHTWGRQLPSHDLKHKWAGSMTLPRQLTYKDGQLLQTILPESLQSLSKIDVDDNPISSGVLEIDINGNLLMRFGSSDDYIDFGFDKEENLVYIDRKGLKRLPKGDETWEISERKVQIQAKKLLILFDSNSIEIIVNNGEESLSSAFYIDGEHYLQNLS